MSHHSCAKQSLLEVSNGAKMIPAVPPSLEENQQLEKMSIQFNKKLKLQVLFSSHLRAEPCSWGVGSNNHTDKIRGTPFPQWRGSSSAVSCPEMCWWSGSSLAVLGVSLSHSVTSVSPPFGTCKSDLINILLQQIWSHILLQTLGRPVTEG